MPRFLVAAVLMGGLLSACTDDPLVLPPAQPMMLPHLSHSIGFTGIGHEPF